MPISRTVKTSPPFDLFKFMIFPLPMAVICFLLLGISAWQYYKMIPIRHTQAAIDEVILIANQTNLRYDGFNVLPASAGNVVTADLLSSPYFGGGNLLKSSFGSPVKIKIAADGREYTVSFSGIDRSSCKSMVSAGSIGWGSVISATCTLPSNIVTWTFPWSWQ